MSAIGERAPETPTQQAPDWSPVPERRSRGRGARVSAVALRAGVGVAIAGLMWWLGHEIPALVLVCVMGVVSGASLLSEGFAAGVERVIDLIQRGAGVVLSVVLIGGLQLLVFTPLWLLLRLFRQDPLALGAPRGEDAQSFWRPSPRSPGKLYRRTFALERMPRQLRGGDRLPLPRLRLVLGLGAMVVLLDLGLGALVHGLRGLREGDGGVGLAAQDFPAGAGEDWRETLGREIDTVWKEKRYDPYLGWRMPAFEGEHVNVSDGVRRSYQAPGSVTRSAPTVYFFGGSTMFGLYQRDTHTIPSEVARLAQADGIPIRVVNHGRMAYVNWQETQLLEQLVAARRQPDLAVFYDGFNELFSQFEEGPHTAPTHIEAYEIEARLDLQSEANEPSKATAAYRAWGDVSLVHGLGRSLGLWEATKADPIRVDRGQIWYGDQAYRPDRRGRLAADLHGRGVDLARRLAAAYDFRSAFFWQPSLYTKRARPGEERVQGWLGTNGEAWSEAARAASGRLASGVVDLSTALDRVREPVMYDFVHTNERGARVIARAMYERLRPTLLRLQREDAS